MMTSSFLVKTTNLQDILRKYYALNYDLIKRHVTNKDSSKSFINLLKLVQMTDIIIPFFVENSR